MTAPQLTIGMPTCDDFHGAWFTVMALQLSHAEVMDRAEILVVDNRPDGAHGQTLAKALKGMPTVRYIPHPGPESSCLPKSRVFDEARAPYVVCMDSHVLVEVGALARLIDYFEAHPETNDLLMGPLLGRPERVLATHQDLTWRRGALGIWQKDQRGIDRNGEPFEIPQQGTGLFACRKAAWPGFHPAFVGHGGNETWLMEKFRQRGDRVLCLPFLRWLHRFGRPEGAPYTLSHDDRVRNYLTGFADLGRADLYDGAVEHFRTICPQTVAKWAARIPRPLPFFDELLPLWQAAGGDASGAIPRELWRTIHPLLRPGLRTLEFGSGLSTWLFDRAGCRHTAIEHNGRWADRVRPRLGPDTTLELAAIVGDPPWYHAQPAGPFDLILVDGPPGPIGRAAALDVVPPLLHDDSIVVVDDLHRDADRRLFHALAAATSKNPVVHKTGQRQYGLLVPLKALSPVPLQPVS